MGSNDDAFVALPLMAKKYRVMIAEILKKSIQTLSSNDDIIGVTELIEIMNNDAYEIAVVNASIIIARGDISHAGPGTQKH